MYDEKKPQNISPELPQSHRNNILALPEWIISKETSLTIKDKFQNLFLLSLNARINGAGTRLGVAVINERQRHRQSHPGIIHPFSTFRWYWDIVMTFALLVALIEQPLQLAFYSDRGEYDTKVIFSNSITAAIFFLDIFFNFRTGIPHLQSDRIILDRKKIVREYLKSWFLVDLLSSIPFDSFYYVALLFHPALDSDSDHQIYFKAIRLLGLLKIFRLFRVIQCLTRIEKAFQLPELKTRLINLLVMIFTIIHWLACWHWLVADLFNPPEHRKANSWVSKMNLWDKPIWFCYINAALRALSNMGCLGYGAGETPSEPEDIFATLASIMIGATFFAIYIGTMGSIVQSVNASEKKFGDVILEVNEYLKFRNIPSHLQNRVKTYYEQRYRRHYFDESMILQSVSDVLRNDLMMHNCKHLVENVPLFKHLPSTFLKQIVAKLKFEVYLPQDLIIGAGSEGQAMYFIQEGQVTISTGDGEHLCTLGCGDFFGEVALVTDGHKTNANVIAKDFCDIYRLDRTDFYDVFKGHPEILAEIKLVARKRTEETKKKISVRSCEHPIIIKEE